MPYQRKDAYYRRAQAAGYRARSAYKLIALDDRHHVLRRGDVVADLGAWPGAWLQVAAERVGPGGRLVGIDLVPIPPLGLPNLSTVAGDVLDPAVGQLLVDRLGGPATVMLCDLSPKLTGVRATDEARAASLNRAALELAASVLRPGGRLVMKLFMNRDTEAVVDRIRRSFTQAKTTRPDATRRGSAELYVVATGFERPRDPVDKLGICEEYPTFDPSADGARGAARPISRPLK